MKKMFINFVFILKQANCRTIWPSLTAGTNSSGRYILSPFF